MLGRQCSNPMMNGTIHIKHEQQTDTYTLEYHGKKYSGFANIGDVRDKIEEIENAKNRDGLDATQKK